MFDVDEFVESCVAATEESEPRRAVAELVREAMATPSAVSEALEPASPGLSILHSAADLTIVNVVWSAGMALPPHDHRMWAVIGIYGGREDNTLYRRSANDPTTVDVVGGRELHERDVLVLGSDAIHSVSNPLTGLTGAIHVYGGDFVHEPRSQWGPGELRERPYDYAYIESLFE